MPAILPETALQRGNAVNSFVSNIGLILGAASAGFLVANFGAALALGIDAATFVYSGIAIYGLRNLTPALQVVENKVLKDLKDGWKVFISFRWIVVIVSCFSFIVMCWAAAENVLGPLIALKKGGKISQAKVGKVMDEYKSGELHSGSKKGPEVTNRKQALAIALSEAKQLSKKK